MLEECLGFGLCLATNCTISSKLQGELFSRVLESTSARYNAFEALTSQVNPLTAMGGGVRSIFAKKTDLKAGGASTVNFNVIGPPAGPGAIGGNPLVGSTSRSRLGTYPIRVGWRRDAITLTKDQIEILSAGRNLVETTVNLLGTKMGVSKQNDMMMRLIKSAQATASTGGNIFRPNGVSSLDALRATDTLSLSNAHSVRARMNAQGAKPIAHRLGDNGSPINGYLLFASDMAMLPIRNDDGFQNALAQASDRGDTNALFTGQMTNWGGMPWYELPSCDEAWDDYIGGPMLPKAIVCKDITPGTNQFGAATANSGATSCILYGHSTNPTKSLFFQYFNGYDYKFTDDQTSAPDANIYYAWAINTDGTVCFLSYAGTGNAGDKITITNILSIALGTSGLGALTVGNLCYGTAPTQATVGAKTRIITPVGTGITVPTTGWQYTDRVDAGAVIIQANANGVQIGRSFGLGAMSACFAYGRIEMSPIEQTFDFGFEIGKGYEMIFGTGVTTNPYGKAVGYMLIEHAIEHEGFATPSYNQ